LLRKQIRTLHLTGHFVQCLLINAAAASSMRVACNVRCKSRVTPAWHAACSAAFTCYYRS